MSEKLENRSETYALLFPNLNEPEPNRSQTIHLIFLYRIQDYDRLGPNAFSRPGLSKGPSGSQDRQLFVDMKALGPNYWAALVRMW
jgi:hypothetical protein